MGMGLDPCGKLAWFPSRGGMPRRAMRRCVCVCTRGALLGDESDRGFVAGLVCWGWREAGGGIRCMTFSLVSFAPCSVASRQGPGVQRSPRPRAVQLRGALLGRRELRRSAAALPPHDHRGTLWSASVVFFVSLTHAPLAFLPKEGTHNPVPVSVYHARGREPVYPRRAVDMDIRGGGTISRAWIFVA